MENKTFSITIIEIAKYLDRLQPIYACLSLPKIGYSLTNSAHCLAFCILNCAIIKLPKYLVQIISIVIKFSYVYSIVSFILN